MGAASDQEARVVVDQPHDPGLEITAGGQTNEEGSLDVDVP
jgi:hypothetical protein